MARGTVTVDAERCKGCGLCVGACQPRLLALDGSTLNRKGYHPVQLLDSDGRCTGCGLCAVMCPDVALTVYRYKAPQPRRSGADPARPRDEPVEARTHRKDSLTREGVLRPFDKLRAEQAQDGISSSSGGPG